MGTISGFSPKPASGFYRIFLRCLFVCILLAGTGTPTSAFDTFWHQSINTEVGRKFGFSNDAVNVLQFSSFGSDYFGPAFVAFEGTVEQIVSYMEFKNLPATGPVRAASDFLHFDNRGFHLDRNWKFDYIFNRMLKNTQQTILNYSTDMTRSPEERKMLVLLTLGASMHMVEDFYSHSDWIHFDFKKMGFPVFRTDDGKDRAPTWFEVRKKFGPPNIRGKKENWRFRVCVGEYPPVNDCPVSSFSVPLSHTLMNHDNSQLYYDNASQIKYHNYGTHPAHDSASAAEHQLFAFRTACGATIEWVELLEKDPAVKAAINFVKDWDLKKMKDDDYADDLEDGLSSVIMASCILKKWDGSNPPPERDTVCNIGRLLTHIHIPKQSNKFWGCYPKDSILENLTFGFGSENGNYKLDSLWVNKQR